MKILIYTILAILLPMNYARASEFYFGAPGRQVAIGSQVEIGVFLNTEGKAINAIEGSVALPADLTIVSIRDGNSIIGFWSEKPTKQGDSSVSFQGILPGGYTGNQGYLFSIIVTPKELGEFTVELTKASVLLNDGLGTQDKLRVSPLSLIVADIGPAGFQEPEDTTPPEKFTPFVANDPEILNGEWFLVFTAKDKESGIGHYEIREGRWGDFTQAESPYLLRKQALNRKIFVKAVDTYGNERVVAIDSQNAEVWYQRFGIFGILIVLICALGYAAKKIWSRFFG